MVPSPMDIWFSISDGIFFQDTCQETVAQLGARVSIMITVGKCAIVDAGSFITKSVKAESHVRSSNIAASEL